MEGFPNGNGIADHINVYIGNDMVIGGGERIKNNWVVGKYSYTNYQGSAFPIGYVRASD